VPDATVGAGVACADLTTFCRLDELGLEVTGQRLDPDLPVDRYDPFDQAPYHRTAILDREHQHILREINHHHAPHAAHGRAPDTEQDPTAVGARWTADPRMWRGGFRRLEIAWAARYAAWAGGGCRPRRNGSTRPFDFPHARETYVIYDAIGRLAAGDPVLGAAVARPGLGHGKLRRAVHQRGCR
jgi:hypothetical protein